MGPRIPTKALSPCTKQPCPALTTGGPCAAHQREYAKQRGSSSQQGYGGAWRRIRAQVIREEPWCREHRKQGKLEPTTDVDHISPRKVELAAGRDPDRRDNLQGLCHACHSAKTMRESVAPYRHG